MYRIRSGSAMPAFAVVSQLVLGSPQTVLAESPDAPPAVDEVVSVAKAEAWRVRGGSTTITLDSARLEELGLSIETRQRRAEILPDPSVRRLSVRRSSSLTFAIIDGSIAQVTEGAILHVGDIVLRSGKRKHRLDDIELAPIGEDISLWGARSRDGNGGLMVLRTKVGFDGTSGMLTLSSGELKLTPAVAAALGDPGLARVSLGTVTVRAIAQWVGGARPPAADLSVAAEGGAAMVEGGDMTFCQLYGLFEANQARLDDVVGLAVATTSWNIGTADLMWFPIPNEEHPFIVMNLYRLKDDRVTMIGQSEIKHGFYALGSHQCGGPTCRWESGHRAGNWLGTNCTDTYGAGLNAVQSGMGPKYEVNPWTGDWHYPGSHMSTSHSHNPIQHRIQVHDADLEPALNVDAEYFVEGYYVMADDVNAMNSAAWQPVSVLGQQLGKWDFQSPWPNQYPNIGFGIDAWPGATKTLVAQEIPVQEFVSPDGRCVLAAKSRELPDGRWRYEYAMLNVDMDRQVGSFQVPVPAGATVSSVGFYAVEHDEPYNTVEADQVAIDNAPWTATVTGTAVAWATATNPLRWAAMYNFWFDADAPPGAVDATVGLFRPGTPSELLAETVGPIFVCAGDTNGDLWVDVDDLLAIILDWGSDGSASNGDVDGSGVVDVDDLTAVILAWGPCD